MGERREEGKRKERRGGREVGKRENTEKGRDAEDEGVKEREEGKDEKR